MPDANRDVDGELDSGLGEVWGSDYGLLFENVGVLGVVLDSLVGVFQFRPFVPSVLVIDVGYYLLNHLSRTLLRLLLRVDQN